MVRREEQPPENNEEFPTAHLDELIPGPAPPFDTDPDSLEATPVYTTETAATLSDRPPTPEEIALGTLENHVFDARTAYARIAAKHRGGDMSAEGQGGHVKRLLNKWGIREAREVDSRGPEEERAFARQVYIDVVHDYAQEVMNQYGEHDAEGRHMGVMVYLQQMELLERAIIDFQLGLLRNRWSPRTGTSFEARNAGLDTVPSFGDRMGDLVTRIWDPQEGERLIHGRDWSRTITRGLLVAGAAGASGAGVAVAARMLAPIVPLPAVAVGAVSAYVGNSVGQRIAGSVNLRGHLPRTHEARIGEAMDPLRAELARYIGELYDIDAPASYDPAHPGYEDHPTRQIEAMVNQGTPQGGLTTNYPESVTRRRVEENLNRSEVAGMVGAITATATARYAGRMITRVLGARKRGLPAQTVEAKTETAGSVPSQEVSLPAATTASTVPNEVALPASAGVPVLPAPSLASIERPSAVAAQQYVVPSEPLVVADTTPKNGYAVYLDPKDFLRVLQRGNPFNTAGQRILNGLVTRAYSS